MKKLFTSAALAAVMSLGTSGGASALTEIDWDMQSTYASSLTQLGTMGKVVSDRLAAMSDGAVQIKFQEPGAIVPALETFDAVSSGAVQAGWSTPGYWTGKDSSLALFAAGSLRPGSRGILRLVQVRRRQGALRRDLPPVRDSFGHLRRHRAGGLRLVPQGNLLGR